MEVPLWIDGSLHFLFSLLYAWTYVYRRKHSERLKWKKKYYIHSLIIFLSGFCIVIDFDHGHIVKSSLKTISNGHIILDVPKRIVHVCHTWQFTVLMFIISIIIGAFKFPDFGALVFLSYFTHILIDSICAPKSPFPGNIFPAQIHRLFTE